MTSATNVSKPIASVPIRWLPLVRASIILMLVIVDVIFVLGIPHFYTHLTTLCELPNCKPLVLTSDDVVMLESVGLTASFYAFAQLAIEIANVLFVNLFCIYYLRRAIDNWLGYVAILTFIQFMIMPNVFWAFFEVHTNLRPLSEVMLVIGLSATFSLIYIFPDGRFVPRFSVLFLFLGIAFFASTTAMAHYEDFTGTELSDIYVSPFLISLLAGVAFQVYRYRYVANEAQRRQMRWVILGFLGYIQGILGWGIFMEYLAFQPDMPRVWIHLVTMPVIMVFTVVPITLALTLAIVQESLWDSDMVVNRTLVYLVVTTLILVTYIFVISLLNVVFDISNNLVISLIATGMVALSFQFVRHHVQRGVNRLIFGQREEPQAILMNLSRQLQTAISPDDLLQTSAMTIAKSLKIPYVGIAIRHGQALDLQTEYGKNGMPTQSFDLIHRNEAVGKLIVGQRSPNEMLNSADQTILSSVAQQLGAVVLAVRLQSDLQTARERLVITREEERRRLRRDLHDGLGPSLASLPLRIDAAIDLIEQDDSSSIALLSDVKSQAQSLVADVRRVVHNLRPPALDDLGLVQAISGAISHIRSHPDGLSIRFHTDELSQHLSAAVEAATYHIVLEAVTNVAKHAQAQHCTIKLLKHATPAQLEITIEDDGIGLPQPVIPNVGLHSMRERSEELGGNFQISSMADGGTHVRVLLPLPERNNQDE